MLPPEGDEKPPKPELDPLLPPRPPLLGDGGGAVAAVVMRMRPPCAPGAEADATAWEDALALYRGDFLPEFPYEDWAEETRARLKRLFAQGLLQLGKLYLREGRHGAAVRCAQQVLEMDPWDEQAALLHMQALVSGGDIAAARRFYHAFCRRLQADLAAPPSASLRQFYQRLLEVEHGD